MDHLCYVCLVDGHGCHTALNFGVEAKESQEG